MITTPFQKEVWTEFIIGACVFFLRFFARWKVVGLKGLALDDLFAAFALVQTPYLSSPSSHAETAPLRYFGQSMPSQSK